jgi:hypothetical protein
MLGPRNYINLNKAKTIPRDILWKYGIIIIELIDQRGPTTLSEEYLMQFGQFYKLFKAWKGGGQLGKMLTIKAVTSGAGSIKETLFQITLKRISQDLMKLGIKSNAFFKYGPGNAENLRESTKIQTDKLNKILKEVVTEAAV